MLHGACAVGRTVAMPRPDAGRPVLRQTRFVTFDGAVTLSTSHQRPDRYRHLEANFGMAKRIPRGAGLSYVAASFGEGVIVQDMRAFNRLLAFDEGSCTVRAEAGITLERLLTWAVQRDLYLPVLPGYPLITVGGCIAADVHGKNPLRDGTFADWVEAITLYHPGRGFQCVTRLLQPELFGMTCGGYGLTGVIVDATLRLTRLPARNVEIRRVAVGCAKEAIQQLEKSRDCDFAYTWHDGAARSAEFGRGILFSGSWTDESPHRRYRPYARMTAARRAALPVSVWNSITARCVNAAFTRIVSFRPKQVKSFFDAAFPFAQQTLYHRFFGKAGLAETQVLVPEARAVDFVGQMSALVHEHDPPLIMMSMKRFTGRQRALSLSGTGILIALNLARTRETTRFLTALDEVTIGLSAQPNVAKDSRLGAATAARALPFYTAFRQRIRQFDPDRLYQSELSERLEL